MSDSNADNNYDMVDLIAQAVIDRLEERDRMNRLADMVIERIARIQTQTKLAAKAGPSNDVTEDNADDRNHEG